MQNRRGGAWFVPCWRRKYEGTDAGKPSVRNVEYASNRTNRETLHFKPLEVANNMQIPSIPEITYEEWLKRKVLTEGLAMKIILPAAWREYRPFPPDHPLNDLRAYIRRDALRVLFSGDYFDEKPWLHVSLSYEKRLPSYNDLVEVKEIFIGTGRQAIQLFPSREKHINFHPYTLHLWCGLEGDGLPDFGKYGTI